MDGSATVEAGVLPLIIIIIIIIAFKGAIQDFLQSPHSAANSLHHAYSSGPGAIVCKSCATHRALITCKCHVTGHLVQRNSSAFKFDRVEIAFIWAYFVGWIIELMKEGENRSTWRKPLVTSFRKCHILQPEDSSPKRDSNPRSSIGGRLGKKTCYPLHHASPQTTNSYVLYHTTPYKLYKFQLQGVHRMQCFT